VRFFAVLSTENCFLRQTVSEELQPSRENSTNEPPLSFPFFSPASGKLA